MKIGLVQDGALTEGADPKRRMAEVVEEAVLAEEMGFDFYGLSEVHFSPEMTISAPEVLLGAIASKTNRIRLRTISTPMLTFNHPIRVAERVATLDLLSGGRMELGTARSNQPHTIQAFEIDAGETRQQYSEGIEIVIKALSQETFEHEGPVWNIPERSLYPKPVQRPHPPVFGSATSKETHEYAGREGLGIMSGNSLPGGWDFVQECLDLYRESWVDGAERGRATNSTFSSLALRAHCAETNEKAMEEAGDAAFETVDMVMRWFSKMAKQSDDYAYMSQIEELTEHQRDLRYLIDRAPYVTIGDPDLFIERCKRLEDMGVDEFILEIDGIGHDKQMSAIRLIGEEVIPKVGSKAKEEAAR
jgi:alkanesulfonate monooxygenase SsuD/methylene tetrahydromethanopterin reductase-like flavin-dependent oxidoreductase (luciferase family)